MAKKVTAKSILSSKTFWIAVVQAALGIVIAFQADPELSMIGGLAVVKSILDIVLRMITAKPVKL